MGLRGALYHLRGRNCIPTSQGAISGDQLPLTLQLYLQRPTLAELTVVPSNVHLKMKFYTRRGRVVTIYGDISSSRTCFPTTSKGNSMVDIRLRPSKRATTTRPEVQPAWIKEQRAPQKVDSILLDALFDRDEAPNGKHELL